MGHGLDQLQRCVNEIKTNPNSRRIVLTSWNPSDVPKCALPPCHIFSQFYVNEANRELSCMVYQRSCDLGLGLPFNIASYALLTKMIAHVCNLEPRELIMCLGNAHVYLNHEAKLRKQIQRKPYKFPKLTIAHRRNNIDDFEAEDFVLHKYVSHPPIKMTMAV